MEEEDVLSILIYQYVRVGGWKGGENPIESLFKDISN